MLSWATRPKLAYDSRNRCYMRNPPWHAKLHAALELMLTGKSALEVVATNDQQLTVGGKLEAQPVETAPYRLYT